MGSPILRTKIEVSRIRLIFGFRSIGTFEAHKLFLWKFLVLLKIALRQIKLIMIILKVVYAVVKALLVIPPLRYLHLVSRHWDPNILLTLSRRMSFLSIFNCIFLFIRQSFDHVVVYTCLWVRMYITFSSLLLTFGILLRLSAVLLKVLLLLISSVHSIHILVDPLSDLDAHGLTLIASAKSTDDPLANTITKALMIYSAAIRRITYKHVDVLDIISNSHWLLLLLSVWLLLWVCWNAVIVLMHMRSSSIKVSLWLPLWRLGRFGKRYFAWTRMIIIIINIILFIFTHESHWRGDLKIGDGPMLYLGIL